MATKEIVVVFDYGHHERDNRGFIGDNEGRNNFNFGRLVKKYLEEYENVKIYETRTKLTEDPSLKTRANKFINKKADLYISWHSNAFNGKARGVEAFDRAKGILNKDNTLLKQMVDNTAKLLKTPNRGVKRLNFAVLGNGNNAKVKMLIEMFFHDNKTDVSSYNKNRDKLARMYADTIAKYYKLDEKEKLKSTKKVEKAKVVEKESSNNSYQIRINVSALKIRKSASDKSEWVGTIRDKLIYTIVEEKGAWGKLKSGAGWIALKFTDRV